MLPQHYFIVALVIRFICGGIWFSFPRMSIIMLQCHYMIFYESITANYQILNHIDIKDRLPLYFMKKIIKKSFAEVLQIMSIIKQ